MAQTTQTTKNAPTNAAKTPKAPPTPEEQRKRFKTSGERALRALDRAIRTTESMMKKPTGSEAQTKAFRELAGQRVERFQNALKGNVGPGNATLPDA